LKGGRRKFKAATVGSKRSFFETLSISHRRLLFSPYLPLPPTQSNKKEKDQSTLRGGFFAAAAATAFG
jgi:hypothetical protein